MVETIAQRDDPHMLDAVIGEQALCIALKHDEPGGNEDRQKANAVSSPLVKASPSACCTGVTNRMMQ